MQINFMIMKNLEICIDEHIVSRKRQPQPSAAKGCSCIGVQSFKHHSQTLECRMLASKLTLKCCLSSRKNQQQLLNWPSSSVTFWYMLFQDCRFDNLSLMFLLLWKHDIWPLWLDDERVFFDLCEYTHSKDLLNAVLSWSTWTGM